MRQFEKPKWENIDRIAGVTIGIREMGKPKHLTGSMLENVLATQSAIQRTAGCRFMQSRVSQATSMKIFPG